MFPSQTSLIPATVALSSFLEKYGSKAWKMNYPYWYLGSTPFKYLTGPVVPVFTALIHKLLPAVSLFEILICLVIFFLSISALGWGILAGRISQKRKLGIIFGLIILIMPWKYFSGLAFAESGLVIAQSLLPFGLILVWNYLLTRSGKNLAIAGIAVGMLFLINSSIFPSLMVGIVALALSRSFKEGRVRFIDRNLKRALLPVVIGLTLSLLWYGPGYWWVQLANPGIGGVVGVKVIVKIFDFLKNMAPLALAVVILYFNSKIKDRITVFGLTWLMTFSILTLYRFIANPVFWLDWSSWLGEIEIGLAFVVAIGYKKLFPLALIPFALVFWVYTLIGRPALISGSIPRGVASLEKTAQTIGKNRIFLSGSTVFWANALFDIYQVRGGRDQVSVNPDWYKAAWVFREESNSAEISGWANRINLNYALIHTEDSREYYHDYKNTDQWEKVCRKVWETAGDILYTCDRK